MIKFLKLICICLLAWLLCPMQGNVSQNGSCYHFTGDEQSEITAGITCKSLSDNYEAEETFSLPEFPCRPKGEWSNNESLFRVVRTAVRSVRTFSLTYGLFLRNIERCLSLCDTRLYSLRAKLFDLSSFYPHRSVCEYYVFSLRRILI